MKALVVINPRSGRQIEDNLEHLISEEARISGFEFSIYRIRGGDDKSNISNEITSYQPQIVAVAGGDGTVNLIAQLLANTDISLLIIPTGSANGMAKELGIGGRFENAIPLISKGYCRKIDLLKINGRLCIHLADVGLNARIVKRFEKDSKRGIATYAKHLLSEIFLIKQYRFYIKFDGTEISRKAVSLTFANASKYGTGAVINPTGLIDDGKFELVIVKPFPRIKLLSIAWKMFIGSLKNSEYVEVISCTSAYIRTSKKTTLQVDGEVIGKTREIRIEILKQALNMIVPNKNVS
jgi:diacylglycerol kinase (ATP)